MYTYHSYYVFPFLYWLVNSFSVVGTLFAFGMDDADFLAGYGKIKCGFVAV